jgi:hypothetical protein
MELKLWIRRSENGAYIVDKELAKSNFLAKPEYKTYTFNNLSELSKWIGQEV